MSIDHRLHHAARELREIPVDTPPLPSLDASRAHRSKIPMVAASLLVVLGGVAVWGGLSNTPAGRRDANISTDIEVASAIEGTKATARVQAISPREELALITALTSGASTRFLQPPAGVV